MDRRLRRGARAPRRFTLRSELLGFRQARSGAPGKARDGGSRGQKSGGRRGRQNSGASTCRNSSGGFRHGRVSRNDPGETRSHGYSPPPNGYASTAASGKDPRDRQGGETGRNAEKSILEV